eukprot:3942630-Prymnesium_polylepis.1
MALHFVCRAGSAGVTPLQRFAFSVCQSEAALPSFGPSCCAANAAAAAAADGSRARRSAISISGVDDVKMDVASAAATMAGGGSSSSATTALTSSAKKTSAKCHRRSQSGQPGLSVLGGCDSSWSASASSRSFSLCFPQRPRRWLRSAHACRRPGTSHDDDENGARQLGQAAVCSPLLRSARATTRSRHAPQKRCPHESVRGSCSALRHMGHSSAMRRVARRRAAPVFTALGELVRVRVGEIFCEMLLYYRAHRKARCPIGTDRHVSPG